MQNSGSPRSKTLSPEARTAELPGVMNSAANEGQQTPHEGQVDLDILVCW